MSHHSADLTRFEPTGHLPAERLAALADGSPTPAEAAHLAACHPCRAEREAVVAVLDLARTERAHVAPPLTDWSSLASALRAEGLVGEVAVGARLAALGSDSAAPGREPGAGRRRLRRLPPWITRVAAAALLVAGGAAVGRVSAGAAPLPNLAVRAASGGSVAALVADTAFTPRSSEEAMAVLSRAERDYRTATAFLAAQADPSLGLDQPETYQRRLAVMDEVAALTRAALYEAPHDPVLNQYYLASLGAREATLQQLGGALPQGTQLNRF